MTLGTVPSQDIQQHVDVLSMNDNYFTSLLARMARGEVVQAGAGRCRQVQAGADRCRQVQAGAALHGPPTLVMQAL